MSFLWFRYGVGQLILKYNSPIEIVLFVLSRDIVQHGSFLSLLEETVTVHYGNSIYVKPNSPHNQHHGIYVYTLLETVLTL